MKFRTEVFPIPADQKIEMNSKLFFIGSCFSQNIGSYLANHKIPTITNPFGVLYNPVSVVNSMKSILSKKLYALKDIFSYNNLWVSYDHHSSFSDISPESCLKKINDEVCRSNEFIKQADIIFITLGTSWVYEFADTGQIVANCHKVPANKFKRYRIDDQYIYRLFDSFFKFLRKLNPKVQVVFTVSPVRHWKDGPVENQLSKSILHVAIQSLVSSFDFVSYFPAYEIVMDDLRDYRFYASDLLHPSDEAIDYILEKFSDTFFSGKTKDTVQRIERIIRASEHRPFNPDTPDHKKFSEKQLLEIEAINKEFPALDFSKEVAMFKTNE